MADTLARIYSPPKSSMQSGLGRTNGWVLEHAIREPKRIDPLTGWYGSGDTPRQVRLHFPTLDAAEAYAKENGIAYEVERAQQKPALRPKSYSDNFRTNRPENWTH
ncbi:ETC complex I subunit [Roseomonas sp. CCTCC AB2023176]|uniref:ETC complex I subunit n=1 Tax=Roseomonas sp. CCTCC AB2023176 TaxID=3342640 RepID=UPI0035DB84C2